MLVNITMSVRGFIPGLKNVLAPCQNYDATEGWIRGVLNVPTIKVYESSSKRLITVKNVDTFFPTGSGGGGSGGDPSGGGDSVKNVCWEVLP